MGFKFNALENIVLIIVMFVGLGVYHKLVVEDMIIAAIQTETTKIENNVDTKVENKFKKIGEMTSNVDLTTPIENTQDITPVQQVNNTVECYLSLEDFTLLRDSDKKRIKKALNRE